MQRYYFEVTVERESEVVTAMRSLQLAYNRTLLFDGALCIDVLASDAQRGVLERQFGPLEEDAVVHLVC